jgi:hypothetical protein
LTICISFFDDCFFRSFVSFLLLIFLFSHHCIVWIPSVCGILAPDQMYLFVCICKYFLPFCVVSSTQSIISFWLRMCEIIPFVNLCFFSPCAFESISKKSLSRAYGVFLLCFLLVSDTSWSLPNLSLSSTIVNIEFHWIHWIGMSKEYALCAFFVVEFCFAKDVWSSCDYCPIIWAYS